MRYDPEQSDVGGADNWVEQIRHDIHQENEGFVIKGFLPLRHGVEVQVEEGSAGGYVEGECGEEEQCGREEQFGTAGERHGVGILL